MWVKGGDVVTQLGVLTRNGDKVIYDTTPILTELGEIDFDIEITENTIGSFEWETLTPTGILVIDYS